MLSELVSLHLYILGITTISCCCSYSCCCGWGDFYFFIFIFDFIVRSADFPVYLRLILWDYRFCDKKSMFFFKSHRVTSWSWDLQGVTVVNGLHVWTTIGRRRILWGVYEWERRDKTESRPDEFGQVMLEGHWREWKVKKKLLLLTHRWSYRSLSESFQKAWKMEKLHWKRKGDCFLSADYLLFILIYLFYPIVLFPDNKNGIFGL